MVKQHQPNRIYVLDAIGARPTPRVRDRDWADLWRTPQNSEKPSTKSKDRGCQVAGGGWQDLFFETREAVLVPEGCDEEVLCWAMEVTEFCVYGGFHSHGDFIDSISLSYLQLGRV